MLTMIRVCVETCVYIYVHTHTLHVLGYADMGCHSGFSPWCSGRRPGKGPRKLLPQDAVGASIRARLGVYWGLLAAVGVAH